MLFYNIYQLSVPPELFHSMTMYITVPLKALCGVSYAIINQIYVYVCRYVLYTATLTRSLSSVSLTSRHDRASLNDCSFTKLILWFSSCSCSRNSRSVTGASRMILSPINNTNNNHISKRLDSRGRYHRQPRQEQVFTLQLQSPTTAHMPSRRQDISTGDLHHTS